MDQTGGIIRFPGNLDPRAEEFIPRINPQINLVQPPICFPFSSPFPSSSPELMPWSSTPYSASVSFLPTQEMLHAVAIPTGIPLPVSPPPPPQPQPLPLPQPQTSQPVPLSPPSATPTRTLLLSSVPIEATQETIWRELAYFGEVRAIQMERLQDGIVTVHFFDLRHAEAALMEIREQNMQQQSRMKQHYSFLSNMRPNYPVPIPYPLGHGLILGRTIWAQFMFPVGVPLQDACNQGTVVVFNLDSAVTDSQLREIFQAFGLVKEVRETPMKRHQRFVEFFDIRDADRAIKEMDGKEINGKRVIIEFSRPGGHRRFTNYLNSNTNKYPQAQPQASPPSTALVPRSFSRSTSDASSSSTPPTQRKFNFKSDNRRTSSSSKVDAAALRASIASLSVNNGSGSDKSFKSGSSNKNPNKNNGNGKKCTTGSSKQQQQQQTRNNKSFKGRHSKMFDSQFLIKEDASVLESSCRRDPRTTVMIKNIPNKYSQKLLLNMLDNHCIHCNEQLIVEGHDEPLSSYDFVYLPIDFNNKCNVGYGFVNMTSPEATLRLYKAFNKQHWEVFNSRKICEITYGRLQGLEALKEHFKNSKFACETDEYLPVLFTPPRDGKQLSEPMAIGGHTNDGNDGKDEEQVVLVDNDEWLHGNHIHDHDEDTEDEEASTAGATAESSSSSSSSSSCTTSTITSSEDPHN